jgi:hypothetical protein
LFFILKIVDLITVVVVVAIVVTISTILCEFVLLLLVGGSEFVSLLGDGELLVEGSGDDSLVALMERFHINTSLYKERNYCLFLTEESSDESIIWVIFLRN